MENAVCQYGNSKEIDKIIDKKLNKEIKCAKIKQKKAIKMFDNLVRAVKYAGDKLKTDKFSVFSKGGYENIVTSADLWVQEYLYGEIKKDFPDAGFICEEEHLQNDNSGGYTFIIDPVDGTQNFARGITEFCVSVGVKFKGEIVFGVVYIPLKNELYTAEKGKGAYLNGERIKTSDRPFGNALFCAAMSVYKKQYADVCGSIIMDVYKRCNDTRRFGSCAIELCYMAKGEVELFFEFRVFPWDYAAACLILREAGGYICALNGEKLPFDKPSMVLAANNEENFRNLIDTVNKYVEKIPYSD